MNKDIKYLYEILNTQDRVNLQNNFSRSPKMITYLNLLEEQGLVSTPKAVATIYKEEEQEGIENPVLVNRFYKLRGKLHLHLLTGSRRIEESMTEEEQELFFLRRLILKNEFAYALEKLKVLEQKCWKDNLFELLPEVLNLLQTALHGATPNDKIALKEYLDKTILVSELVVELQKFKNYIVKFRLSYDVIEMNTNLEEEYKKSITQLGRRVKNWKPYPRFSLLYHYIAFCIGCQIGANTAAINNSLARHLNKLKKLLALHPSMPLESFVPYHRVFSLDFLTFQEAMYWYYRGDVKKSYQCLSENQQLRAQHPKLYFKTFSGTLHNAFLCCLSAKEYQAAWDYCAIIKEQQLMNDTVYTDIPYFVYEALIYTEGHPTFKTSSPETIIQQLVYFLEKHKTNFIWVYGIVGTLSLIYNDLETSEHYLMAPEFVEFHEQVGVKISNRDVLVLVQRKDKKGLIQLLNQINALTKEVGQGRLLEHYESVKRIAKHFI